MTIAVGFAEPYNTSVPEDMDAVERSVTFAFGWFADPQMFGDYPQEMKDNIDGGRLPEFTEDEKEMLKGSCDFLGVNYYTSKYVRNVDTNGTDWGSDQRAPASAKNASGHLIGPQAGSTWLNVYPYGLYQLLNWISKRYANPPMYIFENGVSCPNESQIPVDQALRDTFRVTYITEHVASMVAAYL
mmetsp:Transcript_32721/g.29601  ORF Transcript_32721/g.29601 Transcript_32721/m.29601 type:complete len:186 (-) Transcript_32721:288-845(-)